MMTKLAKYPKTCQMRCAKNLPNAQCFALESFVVFLESVANFFVAKIASFWKFRLVLRMHICAVGAALWAN